MTSTINFLNSIGHTQKVYIRCLAPKNTPLLEIEARGMTYKDKSGQTKKSTVNGYIDLQSGEFYRRYGKDYKPVADGWGHLQELNQQGHGIYFVVAHGGERNNDITHGSTLFHESDKATLDHQQIEIDRISLDFGKPTAVVKTKKSLHAYWSSAENISINNLPTYQRRWLQYSNCDDSSLSDPAQLMRLPGFDHLAWNGTDFDRINCELLQLNEVSYSLEQFDRILPPLDVDRFCQNSLEIINSDASDSDIRTLAPYLPGFDNSGGKWIKAKCPAHDGESSDSLHIDSETGGFLCHAGCSSSSVYNAAKAIAVAGGHRFEVEDKDTELNQNIDDALKMKSCKAPNLFGGTMGKLLREAADNFNIPTSIFEFISLPVLASRIDSRTKLLINPGTDYSVPAVRWCGLVGETGTMKSPVMKRLTKPMSKHQQEIHGVYKEAKEIYDLAFSSWKASKEKDKGDQPEAPIPMLDLFFSNYTIESLADSIQHHPHKGYLILLDELASFAKSLDMYRGGKGSDRQQWLTMWDGGEIKVNRKGGVIYVPQVSLSIVGGIQPQTIRNMISGDESNLDGLWHRFSFASLPDTSIDPFSDLSGDLTDELDKIYTALSEQEHQTYWLSLEAKPLWAEWHYEMQDKRLSANQEMLRGVYPKFEGICGRNALILHCSYAAIAGSVPDQLIPASTMETAIAWTKWELSQTLMQYQLLGLTDDPELARILKFIEKFTGKGWVSARDVRNWWSGSSKPDATEIKSFMAKVVGLGHAIDNDEPIDSGKYRIQILANPSPSSPPINRNHTQPHSQAGLGLVHNYRQENQESSQKAGLSGWTNSSPCFSPDSNKPDIHQPSDEDSELWTKTWTNSSPPPENTVNGHYSDSDTKTRTKPSPASMIHLATDPAISGLDGLEIPSKNIFKIGDIAKIGNDIVVITVVEEDYISGLDKDKNPIGGNFDLFTISTPAEFITTQGDLDDEWN